jgi:hypothetical protein
MKRGELRNLLHILIVKTGRAKKLSCYRMMETPIRLDVSTEGLRWWVQRQNIPRISRAVPREYPVEYCPL